MVSLNPENKKLAMQLVNPPCQLSDVRVPLL
jgi:hypothetical protein